MACALWFPHFSGKRIQFWCDNESVVAIINSGHSKVPRIMDLLRFLVLLSMKHNFFVRARHVPGVSNDIADALSRLQVVGSQGTQNPLYYPAFTNDLLTQEVQTYAKRGLAWATNHTCGSGEKRFIQFCLSNRLMSQEGDILPASEGTLIYFALYLASTVKHSTIKIAAVRNSHISCGHGGSLSGKLLLKKILRVILRYQGQSRILRQPVTPWVLQTIKPILYFWLGDHDFTMVWAAFTLAFFAFLRCSEFTYQGISRFRRQVDLSSHCVSLHLSLASSLRISLFLKASKTDAFRQGHTLVVACSTSTVCVITFSPLARADHFYLSNLVVYLLDPLL